ncbi:MAG: hypothetical protein OXK78_15560 [Caldilineaceae bacterium]|nr:hypothetical protein [Caldilineaceae bacterium]
MALDDYNRTIEIDPTQALYFFYRGLRSVEMNETRRARTDFQTPRQLARADTHDELAGEVSRELRLLPKTTGNRRSGEHQPRKARIGNQFLTAGCGVDPVGNSARLPM